MHQDTVLALQTCESCQIHAKVPKQSKHELILLLSAWPFAKWGIYLVGPLAEASGRIIFLVAAIDYFTKWPEAKPLAATTCKHIEQFVWENIVCRFGIPQEIISDNWKQFSE
ncbi:uncharacterized protein [Rutidosis leptorrhynchoides]|uniref:uncharacterized protein n=1 Tax=Rutidosis leptorrhynchoides TaxID=125765 RepID=UPI003A9A3BEF